MAVTATGANARYRVKKETDYGTAPSGNYTNMPFQTPVNLGSEQPLITDNLLGQGRDPLDPSRDAITVSGDVTVPVDLRYFGIWLAHLFGAPVSTDHSTYQQHIFSSGGTTLPSYSHEIANPDISQYSMESGVMADKLALNFTRTGQAAATISLIGQSEANADTSGAGTPANLTLERFSQFQGSITDGGTALGAVLSATLNYSNGLDPALVVGNAGLIDGIDPGVAALTGTIQMRFRDMTMMTKAINGTPVDLAIAYTISSVKSLTFEAPRIFLPKPKKVIQGPGGINVSFDFQGSRDPSAGVMFKATLKNDLDGTQYA